LEKFIVMELEGNGDKIAIGFKTRATIDGPDTELWAHPEGASLRRDGALKPFFSIEEESDAGASARKFGIVRFEVWQDAPQLSLPAVSMATPTPTSGYSHSPGSAGEGGQGGGGSAGAPLDPHSGPDTMDSVKKAGLALKKAIAQKEAARQQEQRELDTKAKEVRASNKRKLEDVEKEEAGIDSENAAIEIAEADLKKRKQAMAAQEEAVELGKREVVESEREIESEAAALKLDHKNAKEAETVFLASLFE
jgi:hypothetical protein